MNPQAFVLSSISLYLLIYNLVTDPQFCVFPCDDPFQQAIVQELPPSRFNSPPDPNTPIFVNSSNHKSKRDDILNPPYAINNAAGALSNRTAMVRVSPTSKKRYYRPKNQTTIDNCQACEWVS